MNNIRVLFRKTLEKYPVVANSVIYGTLFVAAEFSQQTVTKKIIADNPENYDKPIILRYSIYGTFIGGPIIAQWYRFLDKKFVGTAPKLIVKKLLVDQFIFTPQLLVVFYITLSILERKDDILEECKTKLLPTFKTSCLFWLPVQAINFVLIPPIYRVFYISLSSFAWINILCVLKRGSSEKEIK